MTSDPRRTLHELLEQRVALLREVGQKLVELAKAALQLFELHHHPRQLVVALFGRIGQGQRGRHRLPQELELSARSCESRKLSFELLLKSKRREDGQPLTTLK